jgi:23S rRNA (uracil1939-C5)-methyltransferase
MIGRAMEIRTDRMSHGGRAVGRIAGQVVFVTGAYPGETVEAEITGEGKRHLEAHAITVVDPSPARVEPPCPHFGTCGGCQWQTASYAYQLLWKREIVADQLAHLGRLPEAHVRPTLAPGPEYGYRNRMDFKVVAGRPALLRHASHEPVQLDVCLLMAAPLQPLFHELPSPLRAERVTLRAGVETGETLVLFDDETGVVHEKVAGVRFRITGNAFFQVNTPGAEALVALVNEALVPGADDVLLDGYAGGGLFSATAGKVCSEVVAVESDRVAAEDLNHNTSATVIRGRFERSRSRLPRRWALAVVDPPRSGLASEGVDVVTSGRPRAIAYVACDPASFARDAALLTSRGYELDWVQPVDMFPQTFHIEMVGRFFHS